MKFKLLRGKHRQTKTVGGRPVKDEQGKNVSETFDARDPNKNIVESSIDLEMRFGSEKFQNVDRLTGVTDASALREQLAKLQKENEELRAERAKTTRMDSPEVHDNKPNFDTMSLKELKAYAKANNIDLEGATGQEEIANILKFELDAVA